MQPMAGKKFMHVEDFAALEPPSVTKMLGRPKTKRVRASNEPNQKKEA